MKTNIILLFTLFIANIMYASNLEKITPTNDPYYMGVSMVEKVYQLYDKPLGTTISVAVVANGGASNSLNVVVTIPIGEEEGAKVYAVTTALCEINDIRIEGNLKVGVQYIIIEGKRFDIDSEPSNPIFNNVQYKISYRGLIGRGLLNKLHVERFAK